MTANFDTEEIAPLVKVDDTYYMELFHGANDRVQRYGVIYSATSDDDFSKERMM